MKLSEKLRRAADLDERDMMAYEAPAYRAWADEAEALERVTHRCPKCEGAGQSGHECPYQREVHDNDNDMCTCCEKCERNCADDI